MIRRLIDYIRTPDAYPGRPWAYAANQAGHVLIGAGAAWLTGHWLIAVPIYFAAIEAPQVLFWGGDWADGLEDTAHVTSGALAVALGAPMLAVSVLVIAAGMAGRRETN